MIFKELLSAVEQIAAEKDLSKDKILQTVELAFAAAYKKEYGKKGQKIIAVIDPKKGVINIFEEKIVVDESLLKKEGLDEQSSKEKKAQELQKNKFLTEPESVLNASLKDIIHLKTSEEELNKMKQVLFKFKPQRHIMLEDAKKLVKEISLGDKLLFPLPFKEEFGRIAAQTAKQVIIQKIREAERDTIFQEFKSREGEIISGFIQKIQGPIIYVDLGKTTGIFPEEEQIVGEKYKEHDRMSFYVKSVEIGQKGLIIFLSRSSPQMLQKMIELEVPEVANKIVEIKGIAREAGSRSKVAVFSSDSEVDPIGACVGQKGTRISTIINEFNGEKIDIVKWSKDDKEFIINSLSPAKILSVDLNTEQKSAVAWTTADQQSLAIGKKGQNVRLATKLTGWKIDVKVKGSSASDKSETLQTEQNKDTKTVSETSQTKTIIENKQTTNN